MHAELLDIAEKDGRYAWEAYAFVLDALGHTQRMFGKTNPPAGHAAGPEHHVTARELLEGLCDLARQEFGLMAPIVFRQWGVTKTSDVGNLVFTMIAAGVLFQNEGDRIEDFENVFDLDRVLTEDYPIQTEETGDRWGAR